MSIIHSSLILSEHTKSSTYETSQSARTGLQTIPPGDFVTPVTSISSLITTAQEAIRSGDFATLIANLTAIGANVEDLRRLLPPTTGDQFSLANQEPKEAEHEPRKGD